MKLFIACMLIAAATAAVIPVEQTRHRRDIAEIMNEYLPPMAEEVGVDVPNVDINQDSTAVGEDGYQYKTVRRLKYRQRRDVSEIVNDYLPPSEELSTEAPVEEVAQDSAVLGDDGYHYKTVRRLKYRQRRDVSEIANDYLPPSEEVATEVPVEEVAQDSAVLGDDGYQYKTVRRLKYRQRRDVSEIANDYLPPSEELSTEAPVEEVAQDSAVLGDDGYQYKTVRRLKYRQRRDVSEIANDYLPPTEEVATEVPVEEVAQDSAVLGDDGYQYKTVRRLKYRQRRDVSEIANDYLPPTEEIATEAPIDEVAQDSAVLGDDGYQYKTVRRLKYRQRRDVSEIANDYLPPSEEVATEVPVEEVAQDSAVLGDDGYQYKTVHRLKYRQRRDVSEIANDYLPPTEEVATEAPIEEVAQDSAVLGDDGYQYKTVRRLKYRQRRDVSEIANDYLPPSEEVSTDAPVEEVVQDSAVLGDDGYQYKTVRRLKYRQRRDVSEIANDYLPPSEEVSTDAPVEEVVQDSAVLGDDGYQYKTVRRLKYRQRRDVSEIANDYLPPTEEVATEAPIEEVAQDSAVLGDDGYQYKTVRRLKYRQRRDVSEIANEYLPPSEEVSTDAPVEEVVQDSAVLGDDGYQYKTVRRLKYRQRRDVSEIANDYLPPTEEVATEAPIEEVAQDSAVLGDDGYQYKTVRRLKYRRRRDVSEIANEYLPPSEEVSTEAPVEEVAQDSAVLGDDGYQYKTVRRLKYRQRRDVSEIANDYLPPSEEVAPETPVKEITQDSAVLGDDGYQYKTVHRLKLRRRRAL
ncbi:GH15786 [Drosophila grimshawi]|uniref:GH15786 n=1 Tax=Drosophila grimshawi TaxID=7222 RepID=B4IZ60_DROGR|nr:GH15786 [Drosophila grimshawi]